MNYDMWKEKVKDKELLEQLEQMSKSEIEDAFDGYLTFGTAGLRGKMRPGTNAMNIYTVGRATQGVANYIKDMGREEDGVLVAFDSRNNSRKFAAVTVNILIANGIKVFTFDEIKGVPQTSFGIRKLGCFCGIIITASHNPKIYNGYKVFDFTGSQIGTKTADVLISYMNKVDEFSDVIGGENEERSDKCEIVDRLVMDAYYSQVKEISEKKHLQGSDEIKIVYTPLYGAGMKPITHIFDMCGYNNIHVVEEQSKPNGDFPEITQPNPEKSDCYDVAKKYAEDADVILATDPDCDRLGVVIKDDKGEFMMLTGNQVGCLLLDFLARTCEKGFKPFAVRSIVSTSMADRIADKHGIDMFKVLTGFRYIAARIRDIHDTFEGNFFFGFEESNGYLIGDFIRDKDGCLGALMVAAMVLDYKRRGSTAYKGLMSLYEEFGYTIDESISFTFDGVKGRNIMRKIMRDMAGTFNPFEVPTHYMKNYNTLERTYSDGIVTNVDAKQADVLIWIMEDKNRVVLRPSGTEPKIKFYITCTGKNQDEVQETFENYKKQVAAIVDKYRD